MPLKEEEEEEDNYNCTTLGVKIKIFYIICN
jgi:hypothetical protein